MKIMNAALLITISSSVCLGMQAPLTESDHETFRAIPTIIRLCQDIEHVVSLVKLGRAPIAPTISGCLSTTQGLIFEMGIVPGRLITPWGTINLPTPVLGNDARCRLTAFAATQQFLDKIQVEFIGFEPKHLITKQWLKYSHITGLSVDEAKKIPTHAQCEEYLKLHRKEIPEESIPDFIGKKCFVHSTEYTALYRVTSVDGKLLPLGQQETLETTGFRYSQEQKRAVWNQLQKMNL